MKMYQRAFALGCLLSSALASAAWAQGKVQSLSSDGTVVRQSSAAMTLSASNPGSRMERADDSLANNPSRVESAAEVWDLFATKPMVPPGASPEVIIGPDNRIPIGDTRVYPYRAIVLITFSVPGGTSRCTGWLISPNTVATAGHCVHRGSGGSAGFYPTSSYRIYAGRNGTSSPYGSCTARRLHTVVSWANNRNSDFDYGAIRLNCNIGSTVGWFGFFWTGGSLVNLPTTISGYPGDKPFTQWRSHDRVRGHSTRRIFYQNDTVGGQSGSPVYYARATTCNPCSMAIHTTGNTQSQINGGTRINQEVFNILLGWRNAS